jgi:hypothetical protein
MFDIPSQDDLALSRHWAAYVNSYSLQCGTATYQKIFAISVRMVSSAILEVYQLPRQIIPQMSYLLPISNILDVVDILSLKDGLPILGYTLRERCL